MARFGAARERVRMRLIRSAKFAWILLVLVCYAPLVSAVSVPITCLTQSNATDCAIGESQIALEVLDASDVSGPRTRFRLSVSGLSQMTIAAVYFDDGFLLGPTIEDDPGAGVDFSLAFPGSNDLPGAMLASPPFVADQEFNSGAVAPPPSTGVESGESLGLVFQLMPTHTTESVLGWITAGQLRVGLHVINFASGGSESFLNQPVPEPGSLGLLGASIAGLALLRHRARRT